MPYVVGGVATGAPAAISVRCDTVPEALHEACVYLKSGMQGVYIRDQSGNRIEGADLEACCRGQKSLRSDLIAV